MTSHKFRSGFTLIELLVVISIIALLSTIVLASVNVASAKGRDAARAETMHQISVALGEYQLANGHFPVHTCVLNTPPCGASITSLQSGDISSYISAISTNNLTVNSATNQATYVSDSTGGSYELLYPTETSGYGSTNGCNSTDVSAFGTNTSCVGQNVSSALWNGSSGGGSSPAITFMAVEANYDGGWNQISTFNQVDDGETVHLNWTTSNIYTGGGGSQSPSCALTTDQTGMFSGYFGGGIPANAASPSGTVAGEFDWKDTDSGIITITCYGGANKTNPVSQSVSITNTNPNQQGQ